MQSVALSSPRSVGETRVSALQTLTLAICFLVVAADGFDIASVGYVAPLLKAQWGLTPAQLGPIFGSGLFGLAVGSFLFGPLADRIGRKRVIAFSLLLFGMGSLACAYAASPAALIALRFITGAGLGGAMPNAITMSSEYSPARNRALMVTLMFSGFTIGLACGGAVAALLIPYFGWKGVFVFGGIFPLCLLPVVWYWLPESLRFMSGKPLYAREAERVVIRLTGRANGRVEDFLPRDHAAASGAKSVVATLFSDHYRTGTLLLWLAFFCTLWVYYQVSSWLPTVITGGGITAARAATVGAMLPLGGTLGSLLNAYLMDRLNPFFVLAGSYAVAAASIALIGVSLAEPVWIYVAVFVAGLGLSGAQTGANVLVAGFYTTAARATGVSWALGVGRIGSIIGSTTGGLLLAAVDTPSSAFVIFSMPAVIAGVAMLANGWIYRGVLSK